MRGTRISVAFILECLAAGMTIQQIVGETLLLRCAQKVMKWNRSCALPKSGLFLKRLIFSDEADTLPASC